MEKNHRYNMAALKHDIDYLIITVNDIKVCLHGREDDPNSTGLIGTVMENTKFRKKVTKVLIAVWAFISVPVASFIYKLLHGEQ